MDSNSIAQLVAAIANSRPAPVPASINPNTILIWQMMIAAFTPVLAAFAVWLTKRSTEAKLDEVVKVLPQIHAAVNSGKTILDTKVIKLDETVVELTEKLAISQEQKSAAEKAVILASVPTAATALVLTDTQVSQIVAMIHARRSEPEETKGL